MPPKPRVVLEWNEEAIADLLRELNITRPVSLSVSLLKYSTNPEMSVYGALRGLWTPSKRLITLYLPFGFGGGARLGTVKEDILKTVLHEMRHAHQKDNLTEAELAEWCKGDYCHRKVEIDANKFADENWRKWGHLFKIKRVSKSPLGKLSEAERSVR